MSAASISRSARILIAIDAIVVALIWVVWSPLLFIWHSEHTSGLTMFLIIVVLSTRSMRKKLASEAAANPVTFRRFNYDVAKWLCVAVVVGQVAVATVVGTIFIWIVTPVIIVIAGALLLHEWTELRDVEQKRPNQAPEPTATAVTPPAAQEPRQP